CLPLPRRDEVRWDFADCRDGEQRAVSGAEFENRNYALLRKGICALDDCKPRRMFADTAHERIDINAAIYGRNVVGLDPAIRVQRGDAAGDAGIDADDGADHDDAASSAAANCAFIASAEVSASTSLLSLPSPSSPSPRFRARVSSQTWRP